MEHKSNEEISKRRVISNLIEGLKKNCNTYHEESFYMNNISVNFSVGIEITKSQWLLYITEYLDENNIKYQIYPRTKTNGTYSLIVSILRNY